MTTQYTTLSTSLYLLDDDKVSVHDADTDCTISRDSEGDLLLTMEKGSRKYSTTYKELLQGPCRGLRAKTLAMAIREVMKRRLRGESDFPVAEVLTNPSAKGEPFDLSEDTFEDDDTTDVSTYRDPDEGVLEHIYGEDEVEDHPCGTDEAGSAVTTE